MALNYHQKMAIAWADWGSGLAAAALGPVSFLVGGAASMVVYHTFKASQSPVIQPDPIPISSNDWGLLHNALCSNYLSQGYQRVNYQDIVNLACQVKPELESEILNVSEDTYNAYVIKGLCLNLFSPQLKIDFTKTIINLDVSDSNVVLSYYNELVDAEDTNDWTTIVNNLIGCIVDFNLSQFEKDIFSNSLTILRSSYVLWNEIE